LSTWPADLIIVGTHGRTGLSHALIGSVAEKVVRLAHCPVLVARQKHAAPTA
jgi:glycine betaine transporter